LATESNRFRFFGNNILWEYNPKVKEMKNFTNPVLIPATLLGLSMLLASGCGGGGGGDGGSSSSDPSSVGDENNAVSVVSRGIITGFGSVYVNEIRYHTDSTNFMIDDEDGDESDLGIGMIVTVTGSLLDNGEGSADSIVYDNELKGPVSDIVADPADASRKTLTILGQAVLVTADTAIDDDGGLTFDTIALNDVLEVSGYVTATGFTATHIEKQDNDLNIEIKGHIEDLGLDSFTIGGFDISYTGSTELDDIGVLSDGLFVEVKGQLDGTGTTLIASKIEGENEGLGDDINEAEIKGVISDYDAVGNSFMLQGQMIDATSARLEPASLVLADGITVEAEGYMENGVLIADEVKQKGNKVKIQASLSAVDAVAGTVSFNFNATDITIRINTGTEIEDDITDNNLMLADLSAGNFVEMEGFAEGPGVVNAVEVKRVDPDEIRIEAALENFDPSAMTVALLGVEFDLTAATFEDGNDNDLSATAFFNALVVGNFIEIRDDDSNTVFDKAELDD
jgi:hypothetical protein